LAQMWVIKEDLNISIFYRIISELTLKPELKKEIFIFKTLKNEIKSELSLKTTYLRQPWTKWHTNV